jgi:hypothetical protein
MPKVGERYSAALQASLDEFKWTAKPIETEIPVFKDNRTGARFCECHLLASVFVPLSTTDAPLDPAKQAEYKANRALVVDHEAFARMKSDAKQKRHFSNLVAEFRTDFDPYHPIKIIGGQHRFRAIADALEGGVDEIHGLKVYMTLTTVQRQDVMLISNTNIEVSGDLYDRMQETAKGPALRTWCQQVGFLSDKQDFTDRLKRGGAINVQLVHTFITNFYRGKKVDPAEFANVETAPVKCPRGKHDPAWDSLTKEYPNMLSDVGLRTAATEFNALARSQRAAFVGRSRKHKLDWPDKAISVAVLSAWAYVAGVLQKNDVRLQRLYALKNTQGRDPLNAEALMKGRHHTDPETYRGLGARSNPRELGCLAELFFYHAENAKGITKLTIDVAMSQYFAKQSVLEAKRQRDKAEAS